MAGRGGNWNRAGRRSGGSRPAVIRVPNGRVVLVQLARLMIDEYNAKKDCGVTRAHLRNLVEKLKIDRAALIDVFVAGLGSTMVDSEISRKIAEVFSDDVLKD